MTINSKRWVAAITMLSLRVAMFLAGGSEFKPGQTLYWWVFWTFVTVIFAATYCYEDTSKKDKQ